jgi:hypothetical protein
MFESTIQTVIDDVSFNRESREEGALTAKVTLEGAFTDEMRADLGEYVNDILPDNGEVPTFASVRLDKEFEHRQVMISPPNGSKVKVNRNDVKIKSIRLIKQEANAISLRFVAHLGPIEKGEASFLANEFGHLVAVDIKEAQGELELGD